MREVRKEGAGWPRALVGIEAAKRRGRDEAAARRVERCIVEGGGGLGGDGWW